MTLSFPSACFLLVGIQKIQMAKGIIESSRPRYPDAAIEEAFICVSHIDSPEEALEVRSAYTAFYEFEVAVRTTRGVSTST